MVAPTEAENLGIDSTENEHVHIEDGDETEIEPLRAARDPGCPTLQQVEDHRRTHMPYITQNILCNLCAGHGFQAS